MHTAVVTHGVPGLGFSGTTRYRPKMYLKGMFSKTFFHFFAKFNIFSSFCITFSVLHFKKFHILMAIIQQKNPMPQKPVTSKIRVSGTRFVTNTAVSRLHMMSHIHIQTNQIFTTAVRKTNFTSYNKHLIHSSKDKILFLSDSTYSLSPFLSAEFCHDIHKCLIVFGSILLNNPPSCICRASFL